MLNIVVIGVGGMGIVDVNIVLEYEGICIVVACDFYDGWFEVVKECWGQDFFLIKNYKDILKCKDVDMVIIGMFDYWYKIISIDVMKVGKYVYCEKLMVYSVGEGQELIDVWKVFGIVFMVGSQGLFFLGNEKAKEFLEVGVIGDINYVEGFWACYFFVGVW